MKISQRALLLIAGGSRTATAFVLYNPVGPPGGEDGPPGYYSLDGRGPWTPSSARTGTSAERNRSSASGLAEEWTEEGSGRLLRDEEANARSDEASPASTGNFDLASAVVRWHFPRRTPGSSGLAAGISWALHPHFCDRMIRRFEDQQIDLGTVKINLFVCEDIRAAISVGMRTWSDAHPYLSFHDATDVCDDLSVWTHDGTRCPHAEVTVRHEEVDRTQGSSRAAYAVSHLREATRDPVSTSGREVPGGIGLLSAEIVVSSHLCWYLDATFCYLFHETLRSRNSTLGVRIVCHTLFSASLFGMAVLLVATARRSKWSLETFLLRLPLCGVVAFLFFSLFVPIFYYAVFLPCVDCFDFESTVSHEMGHVLGFHHPDDSPNRNLVRNASSQSERVASKAFLTAATPAAACGVEPLHTDVFLRPFRATEDTLMMSIATHRSRTCLSQDDYDGLLALYPVCEASNDRVPACIQQRRFTGVLRFFLSVAVPFVLTSLLLFCVQGAVRRSNARRMRKMNDMIHRVSVQNRFLRAGMAGIMQKSLATRPSRSDALERSSRLSRSLFSQLSGRFAFPGATPSKKKPSRGPQNAPSALKTSSVASDESLQRRLPLSTVLEDGEPQEKPIGVGEPVPLPRIRDRRMSNKRRTADAKRLHSRQTDDAKRLHSRQTDDANRRRTIAGSRSAVARSPDRFEASDVALRCCLKPCGHDVAPTAECEKRNDAEEEAPRESSKAVPPSTRRIPRLRALDA